jgi:hypothetical protein
LETRQTGVFRAIESEICVLIYRERHGCHIKFFWIKD